MEKKKRYLFPTSSGMVAELTVGFKYKNVGVRVMSQSQDLWKMIKDTVLDVDMDTHIERAWIFLLNRRNMVIGYQLMSQGGLNGTVMDPRLITQLAVQFQVSAVMLVHNHPSGNLISSQQDREMTRKAKDALAVHEISLLDHIIYAPKFIEGRNVETGDDFHYYSFSDEGML